MQKKWKGVNNGQDVPSPYLHISALALTSPESRGASINIPTCRLQPLLAEHANCGVAERESQ